MSISTAPSAKNLVVDSSATVSTTLLTGSLVNLQLDTDVRDNEAILTSFTTSFTNLVVESGGSNENAIGSFSASSDLNTLTLSTDKPNIKSGSNSSSTGSALARGSGLRSLKLTLVLSSLIVTACLVQI
ncbi:predicted protein [Scheffersomyces stipitis CBS 6054]|uniref:Uncharacterized protein n=1 Tax=Scheffersomyces stipitis (strain ATCC 58785 / CBS 6054 / NBRC 10063 / NRRL Y-11545) TaxID=322104 RepID=A3LVB1_PICST|nr:predicted protein [Scheffersomyces stipitis CBS 6054]ABN66747.2 predicted protein [Scheffersomyces stipitis CBS 6054]KAG2734462.1 hypothetical protein G9P44_002468 [Scheffersomyces stipitis]